ncbi:MAG: beta-ketoacyl-ACP reductase [Solirubrobacterales bacterium]
MATKASGATDTDDREFAGKVAFVTGGTRGIGAAISRSLAARGATIAAGFSRNTEHAEGLRDELENLGGEASIHQGNIASADDCRRTVAEVIDRHGKLDIIVNNAGITSDARMIKMTPEDWYTVLAVNLSGAFFCSQAALQHMLERGSGRVVNISSLAGQVGNIGQSNYAASKSGMFGLTKTMALEAASVLHRENRLAVDGAGITVNCVAPGFTATEMVSSIPEKVIDGITEAIPMKRLGRPEEIARVVRFLCADDSAYITGQVWGVNGGLEM